MQNKEIAKIFKLTAQLFELHDANPFKVKSYSNAAFRIERLEKPLIELSGDEIQKIEGIGKGIMEKIKELFERGSLVELDELIKETPQGIIEMLNIKGVGPKKLGIIWKLLGVESIGELLYACNENRLAELKGFGIKTQQQIKESIEYAISNLNKFHFSAADSTATQLLEDIKNSTSISLCSLTGSLRRKCEIIDKIEIIIGDSNATAINEYIALSSILKKDHIEQKDNIICSETLNKIPVEFIICEQYEFYSKLFETTGNPQHISQIKIKPAKASSEKEIYSANNMDYVEPELREGLKEIEWAKNKCLPKLIELTDLKGILHNHTTYSDGLHSLEQMARYCKELGYEYIGITDHSQSAFYANGLKPDKIVVQHNEIDELNLQLAPFKIFKGIEADILNDGSLDYEDEILQSFDFVIASIHSNLKMNLEKATSRLLKAIQNPYTTILGHPTGRLLLSREGYPIDHKTVIDACADLSVIIELNSNPYRLDLDWRWIQYALEKGIKISINPDAHRKEGFNDVYYGVCVGRKAGLTKAMTFNGMSRKEIETLFQQKRSLTDY